MSETPAQVGVIMGSRSDWETMRHATETLESLGVAFETKVVSAHRTPDLLFEYASTAASRGLRVIIAGAGGAAHLPGMTASKTSLPVLGVPVESKALKGMDSLLSIVQMPAGIPVATVSIADTSCPRSCTRSFSMYARPALPPSSSASASCPGRRTQRKLDKNRLRFHNAPSSAYECNLSLNRVCRRYEWQSSDGTLFASWTASRPT